MDPLPNIPTPVKFLLALLVVTAATVALVIIYPQAIGFVLVCILVAALIFGVFLAAVYLMRQRRSAGMSGDLSQHSSAAPRAISDPAQRAKLDDLRRRFDEGIRKFRAAGKDLYSVPWYLVIGESGAGKTEAIRHCNVGFPPGLQDEMQGVGGTINMNWWFTNHSVILDTAGKMVFPEVGAASTREWDEFLGMLRKTRRNCPINGLILVMPADSLIKDGSEEIARKAGRIADQLNKIQRALDVRFPVFVIITKCDLINGFREFFNNLSDPRMQHQMLGWSNPAALDDPFKPDLVDQHFQGVSARIRRRRMGLLQDPTPQNDPTGGRRIDEIDSLFSLPASIELLTPRLRRYLETIFTPNQWGGKPLFLRGIYMASAMREGSALDLELAEAIGMPVDSLPEGKNWERERAYFLRDLFLEKIFKERGLVTSASNTRTLLRRRQALFLGIGFLGLVFVIAFTWFGARSLRESVGRERDFWLAATTGWQENEWRPIVAPEYKGSANYVFNGAEEIQVGKEAMGLAEYQRRLAQLSASDIKVPWVFRPMNDLVAGANGSRRRAQRIVFESGVIAPLVNAARAKVLHSKDNWTPAASEALAFLIRLEGMIANRKSGLTGEEVQAAAFFKPLGNFLYGDGHVDPALAEAYDWVYLKGGDGSGNWPPGWLSAGFSLANNRVIASGMDSFVQHTEDALKTQTTGFDLIKAVRTELRTLRQVETEASRLAAGSPAVFDRDGPAAVQAVLRQKAAVDQSVAAAVQAGILTPGQALFDTYKGLIEDSRRQTDTAFKLIRAEIDRFSAVGATAGAANPDYTLPTEIRRRLIVVEQQIRTQTEGTFTPEELAEIQDLDRMFLGRDPAGDPAYAARAKLYADATSFGAAPASPKGGLVGALPQAAKALASELGDLRDRAAHYQGGYAAEFGTLERRLLDSAQARRTQALYAGYVGEVDARLQRGAGFPLVLGAPVLPTAGLTEMNGLLRKVRDDLAVTHTLPPPPELQPRFDQLDARIQSLGSILSALVVEDGRPVNVTMTLAALPEQRREIMGLLGTEAFTAKFAGTIWRVIRVGTQRVRTEGRSDVELGRFPVSENAIEIDFFKGVDDDVPDRKFTYPGAWSALQWLQAPYARRLPGGKDWEVMVTLKDSEGHDRYLLLHLGFERPLPDKEEWPSVGRSASRLP